MQNSTPDTPPGAVPWILVVDDAPSMRMLIEIILQSEGWRVRVANGAEEAFAAIAAETLPPCLVVCDVLMPKVDGLELVRRMRVRIPDLNVIFISGYLTNASWWPADMRGQRFLAKPFDNAQLIAAVKKALADSGAST